jgi:hypothetical protein
MDKHDIAHYGIAGALLVTIGGVYAVTPSKAPELYPTVTASAAAVFASQVKALLPEGIHVYCAEVSCDRAAHLIAKSLGVKSVRPISIPDGVTVAAKTQADAAGLAKIVHDTLHLNVADAVQSKYEVYLGFGAAEEAH